LDGRAGIWGARRGRRRENDGRRRAGDVGNEEGGDKRKTNERRGRRVRGQVEWA